MMKLTKKELQLFKAVALIIPDTTTQLAKITNISLSYTSTTLKKLGKKKDSSLNKDTIMSRSRR